MQLPFKEALQREQRVAYVGLIVRRLADMGALSEEANNLEPTELAQQVVGLSNMDKLDRGATIDTFKAISSRTVRAVAVVGADVVAPALHGVADAIARLSDRAPSEPTSSVVTVKGQIDAREGGEDVG